MKKKINKYWMNLEQWREDETFQKLAQNEFITPPFMPEDHPIERREFLKLMGASLALTSLGCLRRPAEKIVPYVDRPRDVVPGTPNHYVSSYYDSCGEGFGLIVQTRQGRPVKVEGHREHPSNYGGMSARSHAHLLGLYDPDRLKTSKRNLFNKEKTNKETIRSYFDEMDPEIVSYLKKGKTAVLTDYFPSPFSWKIISDFCKAYSCVHHVWDPYGLEDLARVHQQCFQGPSLIPQYRLDKARLIVSVNCDFLGAFLAPASQSKSYSLSRKPNKDMSELVVFESLLSLTGTNADERHRIRPSENTQVLLILIDEVLSHTRSHQDIKRFLARQINNSFSQDVEKNIRKTAKKLIQFKGRNLVLAGGFAGQTEDAESALTLSYFLNHLLGGYGQTIDVQNYHTAWENRRPSLDSLIQKINRGEIQHLIIHRTNPLYNYPQKEKLISALKKAKLVIYTGGRMDETAGVSDYIIPDLHDLEKWMTWEFQKNCHTIGQPTVRPLIESRSFEDSLIVWARMEKKGPRELYTAKSWHHYLKSHIEKKGLSWDELLKKGFQKLKSFSRKPQFQISRLKKLKFLKPKKNNMELVLYATQGIQDGTLAHISWLQEFPDPVTKICWDNYLCLSPKTAKQQKVQEGQFVELKRGRAVQAVPVHIQPGQSDFTAGLALGYGQKSKGLLENSIGCNGYPLMEIKSGGKICSGLPVTLTPLNKKTPLAVVQGHHSMEGRQIVVEATLNQYLKNKSSGIHRHKELTLWSKHDYPREKWGMVIDLNSCTGCGACVIACQSENNIPVVGKKYVLEGREMHWIRIDRYYKGSPENPKSVVHQPVVCMHCDNAPCETVCPVAATVHSDEGTNDMIYNRCVGTRYCSNNCPYKVRRFNWFNYAKQIQNPMQGALNPEVTVRSRGVMEKCTFCIHRIRSKQAQSRLTDKKLKDGDIQTACQQSCPANAIVFGNLNDKNSKVRQAFEKENAYALLEELNTQPAVRYRTRIKNTDKIEKDDHNKKHG